MKVKALAFIASICAFSCLAAQPNKSTAPSSLVVLYTSCANGQTRSCNCTKFRFGGYGRELTLLKSIRADSKDILLIEGGDACGGSGLQASLKADVTAQAMKILDYGVVVPGEEELGVRGTRYIDRFNKSTVICANLFKEGQSKPIFPPYAVLKTANGLKVAVIGLIDESLCSPWLSLSFEQVVKNPRDVLDKVIKEARRKADFVVVVYHGVIDASDGLSEVKGIDLVLATHPHGQDRIFPEKDTNKVDAPVSKIGDTILVNSETSTNWCLGRLDISLSPNRRIKSVKHKLLYLDRAYSEDPAMVKVYDDYNEKVKQATLASSSEFKKKAESLLAKRGLNITEMRQRLHKTPFVTAGKCKNCHSEIYEIWSSSKHAHATDTLKNTHQEYDPECINCHVTGSVTRNGFVNVKETPEMEHVQCESCHGPAEAHIVKPAKGFGKAGEQTCRSCHTTERAPDFDYSVAWAKIMH